MILVRNLEVFYNSSRRKFRALAGVDLDVEKGGIVALIGPSGCVKQRYFICWQEL